MSAEGNPMPPERHKRCPPPTGAGDSPWGRYGAAAICLLLLLAVIAVFGRTAGHGFVNLDDNDYVYENPHVAAGLTADGIRWALTARHAANWHPLTWLSHMLDCQLFHLHPAGHHLHSVLLHAATAVLLFLLLLRMTGDLGPSALAAALFAVHPLRVESVAWIAERKDVLSGVLFMATLLAYAAYTFRPSPLRYAAVLAAYALGLLAKPMLVTLPCLLLLLDYWPLGRFSRKSDGAGSLECGDLSPLSPLGSRKEGGNSSLRIGERITVAAWKGTVPFSSNENWDSPRVIDSPILTENSEPESGDKSPHSKDRVSSLRRLIVEKIPLAALAAGSCVMTLLRRRRSGRSKRPPSCPGCGGCSTRSSPAPCISSKWFGPSA